ncbi:MAG: hypothetical protein ACLUIQ_01105 [Dialister invisus]
MDMLEEITGKHIHFTQEDRVRMLQRTGKYEFPQCFAMNGKLLSWMCMVIFMPVLH